MPESRELALGGHTVYYDVVLNDLNSAFFAFSYVGLSRAQSRRMTRLINPLHIFKKEYAHPVRAALSVLTRNPSCLFAWDGYPSATLGVCAAKRRTAILWNIDVLQKIDKPT